VKVIVEKTQVDLEAMGRRRKRRRRRTEGDTTLLLLTEIYGHLPVVQCLCEQGADKEARNEKCMTPLHMRWQQRTVTSLWCSTCASWGLK